MDGNDIFKIGQGLADNFMGLATALAFAVGGGLALVAFKRSAGSMLAAGIAGLSGALLGYVVGDMSFLKDIISNTIHNQAGGFIRPFFGL